MNTLKKLSISDDKIIKNEELINMRGGGHPGEGTCAWDGKGTYVTYLPQCYLSRAWAEYYANNYGGHWCCDSCYDGGTIDNWWYEACGSAY